MNAEEEGYLVVEVLEELKAKMPGTQSITVAPRDYDLLVAFVRAHSYVGLSDVGLLTFRFYGMQVIRGE